MGKKIIIMIILGSLLTVVGLANDERFHYIGQTEDGTYYFDISTIRYVEDSNGEVYLDVWIKREVSETDRRRYREMDLKFHDLQDVLWHRYLKPHYALNLEFIYYNSRGMILDTMKPSDMEWVPTVPGSIGAKIEDEILQYVIEFMPAI